MAGVTTKPLTLENWEDLVTVFGGGDGKGDCGRCWCMWWRIPNANYRDSLGKQNKDLFRKRVKAGPPPGLIAYLDGEPVGWVQVGPRADVPNWNTPRRLTAPLEQTEADDPGVWGISCFVVRVGFRRKGVSKALLSGAIDWARAEGAKFLDACPVEVETPRPATSLYHGLAGGFREHGFKEITRRRADRPLMRLAL